MNASIIPYTGSRLSVRFCVKADTFCNACSDRSIAKIVHSQLNKSSHNQSADVGKKCTGGKANKYKGIARLRIKNPPPNSYNIIVFGAVYETCVLLKMENTQLKSVAANPKIIPVLY